ncbi:DUF1822 family protein [Alkalinema sp. FACHB-956]|uniref:DUF1822 family protein n=1 Tax=Alkalinema sp. FACHB-956 TaxID=2692768 RepID=UPI0016861A48|nr:DUF1822 family protein [Alkalinema sp. FACHB-956]MBD2328729.1 DUF1822 family protein [Alkalinema sp. FACHB-956]
MIEFADPKEWWLELSPSLRAEADRQSQQIPASDRLLGQQRAYVNRLCLQRSLTWLREDQPEVTPWLPDTEWPALWEFVNGSAVTIGATRLILLPSQAIDDGELEVPQEWVDIPSWVGDYYLAVQVRPDQGWLRVWGYATHEDLKSIATYDSRDRTYSLAAEQLTQDLNVLWLTVQLCPRAQTRTLVAPLPELSPTQLEALILNLSNPEIAFPRLAVPFASWGALLQSPTARQQLLQQRLQQHAQSNLQNHLQEQLRTQIIQESIQEPPQKSRQESPTSLQQNHPVTHLRDWWQGQFSDLWQAIDAVLLPHLLPQQWATAWRSDPAQSSGTISRMKVLEFGSYPGEESIALILSLTPVDASLTEIRLQICPTGDDPCLPQAVQVRLLDGAGQEIGQARATVTETIHLQFTAEVGEGFQVEVISGDQRLVEGFEV